MGKEIEYEHNGKQCDSTRKELLIALQYLLDNCYDAQHTSKTIDLCKYAEEKGVFLDRRRANAIFTSLVEYTNDKNNTLPYKVAQVSGKPRYYIQKNFFNNADIKAIANAINNDETITEEKANEYLNKFLDKTCTANQKEQVIKKVKNKTNASKHISQTKNNDFSIYEDIMDNQYTFSFRIKNIADFHAEDCTSHYREILDGFFKKRWLVGYMYNVIRKYDTLVIYIDAPYHAALMLKTNNVEFDLNYDVKESFITQRYELKNCKYSNIDEYIELYYKGKAGLQIEVKFKFYIGDDKKILKKLKKSYEDYFKQDMKYELVDRPVEIQHLDGTTETIVAKDAVTTVTCNFNSFKNWYWSSGAYDCVVILSPKHWNNRLLSVITRRFKRRIEKYGVVPTRVSTSQLSTVTTTNEKAGN